MSEENNEELYAVIPLKGLRPGVELVTDVYLKINGKVIKYKEAGDKISSEKLDFFIAKHLYEIYVLKEFEETFNKWVTEKKQDSINSLVEEVGEEHRDLAEKREEIRELIYETFSDQDLDSKAIEVLQYQSKEFITTVSDDKVNKTIIAKLSNFNSTLADHSVNTASLSVYIAMCCGFGNQYDLENVYMGALLHDYGKVKIPANTLENKGSAAYSQAILDHPYRGMKMIKKMKDMPEEIQMIVAQHHEQFNGNGFPKSLKGQEIYKFAMIVAIANIFNNTIEDELIKKSIKKPNIEIYRKSIKVLEYDKGKQFSPEYLERAIDGLKLAFGNYQK
ncbi:MAG: HD domain-containing protein [Bacteriovoracaceae bacterium]|nr:HD domain-containing protein [Bacteriovoracaceae bacterium]